MDTARGSSAAIDGFSQGRIAEQKIIVGISDENKFFPNVLLPAHQYINSHGHTGDIADVTQTIRNKREWIEQQLMEHSALLFRGFPLRSAADFSSFVEAFGWEEHPYVGFAPRTKVEDRIYTANEGPLHEQLGFHHEMSWEIAWETHSYFPTSWMVWMVNRQPHNVGGLTPKDSRLELMNSWPSKVFFFCETAPPEGGQTAIVLSQSITQRMENRFPEFVSKLKDVGLVFTVTTPAQNRVSSYIAKNWQTFLETNDPSEAKKRASEVLSCASFECFEDGSAKFVLGPLEVMREFEGYGGRPVWFLGNISIAGGKNPPLCMGDGSEIPGEAVEAFRAIVDEECVNLKWEEGDVLLVDNRAVQHGKRPSKPPRRILVSMCK